jgi:hypothetical protein
MFALAVTFEAPMGFPLLGADAILPENEVILQMLKGPS